MKDLKQLREKCKGILGHNNFYLCNSEQSYNVHPTEHIHLCNGMFSINTGHSIYGNITVYDEILNSLEELHNVVKNASEELNDHVSIVYLREGDQGLRSIIGGLQEDRNHVIEDFETIEECVHFLKTFEWEESPRTGK